MEKLSGLILDLYDDTGGEVLKAIYPDLVSIPEIVKLGHRLSPEELAALPDDSFALVLQDGDTTLRKYACIDAGNTLLSLEYLAKVAHLLPKQALEVAEKNLKIAASWYCGDEVLEKSAGMAGAALSGLGSLATKAVGYAAKNPLGALTHAGTAVAAAGALGEMKNNLRAVAPLGGQIAG